MSSDQHVSGGMLMSQDQPDARVKFWICPDRSHRFVEWDGAIATCKHCGATNEALNSHAWDRYTRNGMLGLRCTTCGFMWRPDANPPKKWCTRSRGSINVDI